MAGPKIHELPEQDRPREKLARCGASALSDSELIAILLRTGLPGCNAVELARQLITRYGSLAALSRCTVAELAKIKGVGSAKAVQLAAAFGLGDRLAKERLTRQRLDTPALINELLGPEMRALNRESLRAVLLDTKYFLLRIEEISLGSLNESIAHPREIFHAAIVHSAFALIVVHNHPSGDPTPSTADRQLTRRLVEAASLLQIRLLDHVIIGNSDNGRLPYFSFNEAGLM
ncbi:MAG TPA: DNA repair protein RadC [Chthoniobacteraceae bacterium]|jgi:DNA repair protein RadC